MSRHPRPDLRLIWAAWTIPALLSTFETIVQMSLMGRPVPLWRAFISEAPGFYVWALATPAVLAAATRWPVVPLRRLANVVPHLAIWLVTGAVSALVSAAMSEWFRSASRGGLLASWRGWLLGGLPLTITAYAGLLLLAAWIANRERLAAREREAAELARALSESQLSALRAQLQPHFLFNSLNGIIALVRDAETARATSALEALSELLRAALRHGAAPTVALSDEVAFARDYLAVEQMRFADRLRVSVEVPPALLDARVPTFVLQPLVENAVKHNLMARRASLAITIAAVQDGGVLVLRVADDGVGPGAPAEVTGGVGLKNLRERLARMFGDAGTLAVTTAANGGTVAEVRVPLDRAVA